MSLTEVYTESGRGRTASTTSISLRGRSPHPEGNGDNTRKSFEKAGEIELAELGPNGRSSRSGEPSTGKTSPANPAEPTHLPPLSKWKEHVQFATLCFVLFLAGWNDGTTGPLLPRIQSNYHVSVPRGAAPFRV